MRSRVFWTVFGFLVAVLIIWGASFSNQNLSSNNFNLTIFSIVEIEPIAQLRKGFKEEFSSSQFSKEHKVVITEENAQGDGGLINQIVDKIIVNKPDLVYILGTPAAQAVQKRAPDILIVQGAVTDPVSAGLADSWQGSGRKYVATSDLPPINKQLELIKTLTPNVSRLGIIYNPGESNSVAIISRLKEYIKQVSSNLALVERPIANSGDVARAVESLVGNVDAIYLPPDNTAYSAVPVIGKIAQENKIPLYATTEDALAKGAIATLSLDWYELGKESAQIALEVLGGKDPAIIPIKVNENPVVAINASLAKSYNIDISSFRNKQNIKIIE